MDNPDRTIALDRMIAIAVRIAEREGLLFEDEDGLLSTKRDQHTADSDAAHSAVCHSPAIPFPKNEGTRRDDEGETFHFRSEKGLFGMGEDSPGT